MKNLLKTSVLLALAIVPMSAFAQETVDVLRKHAINTKGAGSGDKLAPCPAIESNASADHAINTKGAGANDRSITPKVAKESIGHRDVKDPETALDGRLVQSGCNATVAGEAGDSVTFRYISSNLTGGQITNTSGRLKVWQLMQGQNGTQAMRSNKPIIEKDMVNIVDRVTVENFLQGPCKPPYMCDFVWEVQAVSADGKLVGKPQGGYFTYELKSMK